MYADTRCITPHRITFQQANMLTVAGANHIITMDLHASQVSSVQTEQTFKKKHKCDP